MSVPCEIAVKCVLPAVRAMTAKQLMAKHGLNQAQAAKLLGLSQPAISLYSRKIRGKAIDLENDKNINLLVEELADSLVKSNMSRKEFIMQFCRICREIRAKGLMCKMHKTFDASINIEECELCKSVNPPRCL